MRRFLAAAPWVLLPAASRACAVCFGVDSPDMAKGFYWGILLLLLLPPSIILGFVGVIAYNVRRHRRSLSSSAE